MTIIDRTLTSIPFDNSYARLPDRFYARLAPTPVPQPELVRLNRPLAAHLGIDADGLETPEGIEVLAGNRLPAGADPIAMAYAGHQFGGWVPQLGDGRAILLGEVIDRDGIRRDIQLKGAGRTPFSRMGDGRAVLGPVLREYIVSEAMAALGVPTTRALAAVTTGQNVARETLLPGAVLTRVARSHVRVGTFQYFAARHDEDALRRLVDHVIARHDPDIGEADTPAQALLEKVIARQAELIAQWMSIGFIHGVMNTDNMSIAGETIDYGPCAFMDHYHPETVYSSIDEMGRYAYGNQPRIGHWNLACLAQSLMPLLADTEEAAVERAQAALDAYPEAFNAAYSRRLLAKIGITEQRDGDLDLVQDLMGRMAENEADFTLTFRGLSALSAIPGDDPAAADQPVRDLFQDREAFDGWAVHWRARLVSNGDDDATRQGAMRAVNPAVIPRNHLVEDAIAAAYAGDLAPFDRLMTVLATPYTDKPDTSRYTRPPEAHEVVQATFCGT